MSELRDFELETVRTGNESFDSEPPKNRKGKGPLWLVLILLLVLAAGATYYVFFRQPPPPPPVAEPAPPQPLAEKPPEPELLPEPEPEVELPALDESDDFLRLALGSLTEHPQVTKWLVTDGLARRFVVTIDNLAEGVTPKVHLPFLTPKGKFKVLEEGGNVKPDPASFRRYDIAAEAFTSLDTAGSVALYQQLEPLLQQAYEELGYPNREFSDTLTKAINHLLATPVPNGEEVLTQNVLSYDYADSRLANLSPAQKQLLRTGPDNVRRIQTKLRQFKGALGSL